MEEDLQRHSDMLGQIAAEVSEWCCHEDCTTLDGVRLMKADLLEAQAKLIRQEIFRQWND